MRIAREQRHKRATDSEGEMKYRYIIEDFGQTIDDAKEFESTSNPDCKEQIAEDAADHAHQRYFDSSWPIVFSIYDMTNKHLGNFEVERVPVPSFHAVKVK